jgi:hypothetical protein
MELEEYGVEPLDQEHAEQEETQSESGEGEQRCQGQVKCTFDQSVDGERRRPYDGTGHPQLDVHTLRRFLDPEGIDRIPISVVQGWIPAYPAAST